MEILNRRRGRLLATVLAAVVAWAAGTGEGRASERLYRRGNHEANSFSVRVAAGGQAVPTADVFIGIHRAGVTDGRGVYRHFYTTRPEQTLNLSVRKPGFREWKGEIRIRPGTQVGVELIRDGAHRVLVRALTERFGVLSGIAGMEVVLDGDIMGVTGTDGEFFFSRDLPGPVDLEVRHPQGLASPWIDRIALQGDKRLQRFFYLMEPQTVRVGIVPFRVNGYQDDAFQQAREEIRRAMVEELAGSVDFRIVDDAELDGSLEWFGIDTERVEARGWEDTDLRWDLDLVLIGSLGRDDEFVAEVEARGPGGEEILRVLGRAASADQFADCGRRIARAIIDRYPYEWWILAGDDHELQIQLTGSPGWQPRVGDPVLLQSFVLDPSGRRLGETPVGSARITAVENGTARARIEMLHSDRGVSPGDRARRYVAPPPGAEGERVWTVVARAGESQRTRRPLEGVNVYLDGFWIGRTDRDGRAELRLPSTRSLRIDLYRHGYGPAKGRIDTLEENEENLFLLPRRLSELRIESEPSDAAVWLDGKFLGRTPLGTTPVSLGDHELRLTAAGSYREFRRTMAFLRPEEDFTGGHRLVLERDYLDLGRREERDGDLAAAMTVYREVPAGHTDAWEAHRRLGFLLLEKSNRPAEAIQVFQELLATGEVFPERADALVEVFAGIGQAYFDLGTGFAAADPQLAQTRLLQAIFYLQRGLLITAILPEIDSEQLLNDIHWHRALAYQKLFALTDSREFLREADQAWRDYFEFEPISLQQDPEYRRARKAGRRYWSEVQSALP